MTLFDEDKKDYYETLGIAKNAGTAEIKRAYFGLVRKYQPDRFPEEFKEIRAAYETLSDQKKRAEYDVIGELPSSVAPLFYEAQRLDRLGRHGKAAPLYQRILKSRPELDHVREQYARSFLEDDKTGKAIEVWEELCRRRPDNPHYARELAKTYNDRGWSKKAVTEAQRAIALDRGDIDGWSILVTCTIDNLSGTEKSWNETRALIREALEAVKNIKTDEWKKIYLHTHAFITSGLAKKAAARAHLQEILRLTREGGQESRKESICAFEEILRVIPAEGLGGFYPELKELSDLLSNRNDKLTLIKLNDVRLCFEIEGLVKKGFHEIFRDLFRVLMSDSIGDEEDLEILAIECVLLERRDSFLSPLRRLKEDFPELYDLHGSFFNELLRTRNPDKMLFQRSKKLHKLSRLHGVYDEDPESAAEQPVRRSQPKVGRNDPCPCGSGRKYKHCCGKSEK